MHMLVKNAVGKGLVHLGLADSKILLFALTTLATVVVAGLSFRYFESIFLRRKARYSALA
jgi:peptidoglycan/LPS O-acetylase OafA/YrhL